MPRTPVRKSPIGDQRSLARKLVAQPREESRRERTLRIGPARVAATVKAIRHLRQLANPNVYDLRGDEPRNIPETLKTEIEALAFELQNPGQTAGPTGVFEVDQR